MIDCKWEGNKHFARRRSLTQYNTFGETCFQPTKVNGLTTCIINTQRLLISLNKSNMRNISQWKVPLVSHILLHDTLQTHLSLSLSLSCTQTLGELNLFFHSLAGLELLSCFLAKKTLNFLPSFSRKREKALPDRYVTWWLISHEKTCNDVTSSRPQSLTMTILLPFSSVREQRAVRSLS